MTVSYYPKDLHYPGYAAKKVNIEELRLALVNTLDLPR